MGLLLFMTDLPDIPARCKCRRQPSQNPPTDKCCNNIVSDNHISPLYFRSVVAEKRELCNKGERLVYLQTKGAVQRAAPAYSGISLHFSSGEYCQKSILLLCACAVLFVCVLLCLFSLFGPMISVLWYITCTFA